MHIFMHARTHIKLFAHTHTHTHIHTTHTHTVQTYSFQHLFFQELSDNRKHNIKECWLMDIMDSFEASWECLLEININDTHVGGLIFRLTAYILQRERERE